MPIGCLITFDNNPQGVYYAGQELSGTVDFNVDITKRIKGIIFRFAHRLSHKISLEKPMTH